MMLSGVLFDALKETAPITGVSIGQADDKSTWRIDFADRATDDEKAQVFDLIKIFDVASSYPVLEISAFSLCRDLVDVLVAKKIIALADLPQSLLDLLKSRQT